MFVWNGKYCFQLHNQSIFHEQVGCEITPKGTVFVEDAQWMRLHDLDAFLAQSMD